MIAVACLRPKDWRLLTDHVWVFTTASNASLILASIPAITTALAAIFLREKVTRLKTLGIIMTMFGVVMIIFSGDSLLGFLGTLKGEVMILGSALCWAIYTITSRSLTVQVPHILITAYSIFIGTLFLTPFSLYEYVNHRISSISVDSWAAMFFLGVIASGTAFFLYNYSLKHIEAAKVAAYVNLSPFVTILAGIYFLNEELKLMGIMGGILIIAGIFMAGLERSRMTKRGAPWRR